MSQIQVDVPSTGRIFSKFLFIIYNILLNISNIKLDIDNIVYYLKDLPEDEFTVKN